MDMIKYAYLKLDKGMATIAYRYNKDNTIEVSASFCSPNDNFVKKIGRDIAMERLEQKKEFYVNFERDIHYPLIWQIRDIVKMMIAGKWVSVLDFSNEINLIVYEIITETSNTILNSEIPHIEYTNTIPHWAKIATLNCKHY